MGTGRPCRLFAKIHVELLVERESPVHRVAIHLQDRAPNFRQIGIELVIPGTQQRVGDVESLAIQTQLQHLWPTDQLAPLHLATLARSTWGARDR